MGRKPNRSERRREIVDAMIRVMARRGYAGASVASVAREAELAPGLLHYHFKSKEEILLAVVQRLEESVTARFARRTAQAERPRARLDAFLDAHLALGSDADPDAVACWVALGTEALTRPGILEAYGAFMSRHHAVLGALVEKVLVDEGGDPARAPQLASALLAAIEGTMRLALLAPGLNTEGTAAGLVRDMARGLLAGEGA